MDGPLPFLPRGLLLTCKSLWLKSPSNFADFEHRGHKRASIPSADSFSFSHGLSNFWAIGHRDFLIMSCSCPWMRSLPLRGWSVLLLQIKGDCLTFWCSVRHSETWGSALPVLFSLGHLRSQCLSRCTPFSNSLYRDWKHSEKFLVQWKCLVALYTF